MMSHCSFLLGFNAFSFRARITSGIAVSSQGECPIGFDKFGNSNIDTATRFETRLAQTLVRDDVIPLVGILADLGVVNEKLRYVLLNLLAQLLLGQVGAVEAQI